MDAKTFIKNHVNAWPGLEFEAKAFSSLGWSTELRPRRYLEFANIDLEAKHEHSRINALSNAKRAIDCQVDNLLSAFGLKKGNYFPERIEGIASLGLVAPRIIRKVIKIRNKLEHEYYNPSKEEVEDSIDIAQLFMEATTRQMGSFMTAFFVAKEGSENKGDKKKIVDEVLNNDYRIRGYTYTESLFVDFDVNDKCFHLDFVSDNKAVVVIDVDSSHKLYPSLVSYTIAHHHDNPEWEEEEPARLFVEWLNENQDDL